MKQNDWSLRSNRGMTGFTLLEIIIVLAVIGLIAKVILPGLHHSNKSAVMNGINDLSSQVTLAHDNALFTGRMYRMVFDVKNGVFWTEVAPKNFSGRAPVITAEFNSRKLLKEPMLKQFDDEAQNATNNEAPILEIPVRQRAVLVGPPWMQQKNTLVSPKQFSDNLIFVKISTGLASNPISYPLGIVPKSEKTYTPEEAYLAYIYFFPDGVATPASFQIGFQNDGNIDNNALKFTLNLNTFTGKLNVLQGFQEANFELPR